MSQGQIKERQRVVAVLVACVIGYISFESFKVFLAYPFGRSGFSYDALVVISALLAAGVTILIYRSAIRRRRHINALELIKLGDSKLKAGDHAAAWALFEESGDIERKLGNEGRQLAVIVNRIGDAKQQMGDRAGALAAYKEGLHIARTVATRLSQSSSRHNAQAQADIAFGLYKLASVLDVEQAKGALAEALSTLEPLERSGELTVSQAQWCTAIRAALATTGKSTM